MNQAIILGGAECVWDDLLQFEEIIGGQWNGCVIAVNDIAVHWPRRLDHLVTLHPRKLHHWKKQRDANGFGTGLVTWSTASRHSDHSVKPWGPGSSGLLAVQVAIENLHMDRVVLCGVPMTPTKHFDESNEEHLLNAFGVWRDADKHWLVWENEQLRLIKCIRSMSGRSRELLGAPTRDWFFGD